MDRKNHIDSLGAVLLVACSALMGVNQVVVKLVNVGLQPVFQAGLRSALGLIPILIYAIARNKPLNLNDGSFWPGVLAGLFFAVEFLLLFLALDYTTVSRASIFFYTMPFWTALSAHWLIPGERLTLIRVIGLILAVIGITLAFWHNHSQISDNALIGDLFCIIAAMCWSGIIIVARTTKLSRSCPEMQLIYQLGVSAILLLIVAPLFGELIRDVNATILWLFSFQIFVVVCFGFLTWFWLLSVYPASDMASYSFLAPIFGVIFGWWILDEVITPSIGLALVLVCAGVYMVNRKWPKPGANGI